MCEYLRPVVALEWLKACCTDMITSKTGSKLIKMRQNNKCHTHNKWILWCFVLCKIISIYKVAKKHSYQVTWFNEQVGRSSFTCLLKKRQNK